MSQHTPPVYHRLLTTQLTFSINIHQPPFSHQMKQTLAHNSICHSKAVCLKYAMSLLLFFPSTLNMPITLYLGWYIDFLSLRTNDINFTHHSTLSLSKGSDRGSKHFKTNLPPRPTTLPCFQEHIRNVFMHLGYASDEVSSVSQKLLLIFQGATGLLFYFTLKQNTDIKTTSQFQKMTPVGILPEVSCETTSLWSVSATLVTASQRQQSAKNRSKLHSSCLETGRKSWGAGGK